MSKVKGPHQEQSVTVGGAPLAEATSAMILVHGRGATAPSILTLKDVLPHEGMAYLAPQASNNTWYGYSFLAPLEKNQPGVDSGLQAIADLVAKIEAEGIPTEKIVLAGFSQGACLTSEFVARHAKQYGAVFVFSGGVIGPEAIPHNYEGSLAGTPIFLGCSDRDMHIPLKRVHETTAIFEQLGGQVTEKIYPNMPHTIIQDEIDEARKLLQAL